MSYKGEVVNFTEVGPSIFVYDNILQQDPDAIISLAKETLSWEDAGLGSNNRVDKDIRHSKRTTITSNYSDDTAWFILSKTIWTYADHYAKENNIVFRNMEIPQMLWYPSGSGFYSPHYDSGPAAPRIFSCVLYLNDVEDGGETYFNKFDIAVKPRAGRMVMFPANYTFLHEARPPISNDKYVVVDWFSE